MTDDSPRKGAEGRKESRASACGVRGALLAIVIGLVTVVIVRFGSNSTAPPRAVLLPGEPQPPRLPPRERPALSVQTPRPPQPEPTPVPAPPPVTISRQLESVRTAWPPPGRRRSESVRTAWPPPPALAVHPTRRRSRWPSPTKSVEGHTTTLDYPPVKFWLPVFGDALSRTNWMNLVRKLIQTSIPGQWFDKARLHEDSVAMPRRLGKVSVLTDPNDYAAVAYQCARIGAGSEGSLIKIQPGQLLRVDANAELLIDLGGCVEAWYFGHFIDQCMQHLLQALYVLGPRKKDLHVVLRGNCRIYQKRQAGIELMELMGIPKEHVHCNPVPARAAVVSCIAPHTPFLYKLANTIFTHGIDHKKCAKRVVYFSRARGIGSAINGGRRILNEDELLASLNPTITRLGLEGPDTFSMSGRPYREVAESLADVCLFFGPHGGAFYNTVFGRQDAAFLELNSKDTYIGPAALIGAAVGMRYGYMRPHLITAGVLDFKVNVTRASALFDMLASSVCSCGSRRKPVE